MVRKGSEQFGTVWIESERRGTFDFRHDANRHFCSVEKSFWSGLVWITLDFSGSLWINMKVRLSRSRRLPLRRRTPGNADLKVNGLPTRINIDDFEQPQG